jgi:hypothetical protein
MAIIQQEQKSGCTHHQPPHLGRSARAAAGGGGVLDVGGGLDHVSQAQVVRGARDVAVQEVECECKLCETSFSLDMFKAGLTPGAQALKPGFHFIGSRVETRRFQATGQLITALHSYTAPP